MFLKDIPFWNFKEFKGFLGILRNCHERMPPYFVAIECY